MDIEYKDIKKYLLENEFNEEWFKEEFKDVELPNLELEKGEKLIFTDGFLFTVKFLDNINKYEYDYDRFYTLTPEQDKFIKMDSDIDIRYNALDFIEDMAEESEAM